MVQKSRKSAQLQIRVSPEEKAAIKRQARQAGMDVSSWVLGRILHEKRELFQSFVDELARGNRQTHAFAAIHDLLAAAGAREFGEIVADPPRARLSEEDANYLAAMIEHAADAKQIAAPTWTKTVGPLLRPMFASDLKSLRLHLLINSPPAFRKRNIFVNASVGERV